MITQSQCQHCGGAIEFDAAQFERFGETSHRILGQNIDCPHCEKSTQLYLSRSGQKNFDPTNNKSSQKKFPWLFAVIGFSIVGLIVFLGWLFSTSDWAAQHFGDGLEALFGCIAMIFGFVLAAYWTVFPLLMSMKLNGIRDALEKIERNTRKP